MAMDLEPLRIDRSQARSRGGAAGRWWIAGGAVVLLLVALAVAFRGALGLAGPPPAVETARVESRRSLQATSARGVAANGYVVAGRRAALSADTPGRIVAMNVTEGSVVSEGDVVARLYSEEYAAALARAEADREAARAAVERSRADVAAARADLARLRDQEAAAAASVESAEADVELARVELERARRLAEARVGTPQALDLARAELRRAEARLRNAGALEAAAASALASGESRVAVAEAEVEVGEARVAVAEAAVTQARATLSKTEVRAPFDGVVVLKDAEVGEVVSPNTAGGSNARGSVVTMVDFASLEVQVDVPETSLAAVQDGAPVQVFLDAFPRRPYAGRVERIWPTANRQKATVEVRISFAERDERLRPDMGCRVVFLDEEPAPAADAEAEGPSLTVPEGALVQRGGEPGVFRLEGGRASFVVVEAGAREAGRIAVSGVQAGDVVVLDPPAELDDGDAVAADTEGS